MYDGCCVFFFFKQKTAYEMRISDWSSDVCSSDLIPIGVRPLAPRAARSEPLMLIRGVRPDLIDEHLEPQRVCVGDQRVEIRERAEDRVDLAVIGAVITEIGHRRGIERRQPDRVDAESHTMRSAKGQVGKRGVKK